MTHPYMAELMNDKHQCQGFFECDYQENVTNNARLWLAKQPVGSYTNIWWLGADQHIITKIKGQ